MKNHGNLPDDTVAHARTFGNAPDRRQGCPSRIGDRYLVVLAGPNGAGKSTFYDTYLAPLGIRFVNADLTIKRGENFSKRKFPKNFSQGTKIGVTASGNPLKKTELKGTRHSPLRFECSFATLGLQR